MAFNLYILYIVSYLLHLPSRLPFLGTIRFDLLLVGIVVFAIIFTRDRKEQFHLDETSKWLAILVVYIIISLPFVEWPGTVLRTGVQDFLKVVVFYVFTLMTVTSDRKLRILILVFAACQVLRIVEPVLLHVTTGYWGDTTFMGRGEMMDRLAGAPHDRINPNGLAYVIVTAVPFCQFLRLSSSWMAKLLYLPIILVSGYALILTGSRSGFVAALVGAVIFVFKSKTKVFLLVVMVFVGLFALGSLNELQRDRYLSIYREDVRGASTARGRIEGLFDNMVVALNKPFVGHGLGASSEANFNIGGSSLRSHNLYIEIWQELGLIGLFIFLAFMVSVVRVYLRLRSQVRHTENTALIAVTDILDIWLPVNLVFSLASYGLSSYPWYFTGGLAVTTGIMAKKYTDLSPVEPRNECKN